MLYIRCSTLILNNRLVQDGAILMDGQKIVAVGPRAIVPAPTAARQVDAHGLIAAPGYIDWQLNGGFGEDFTENPESLWKTAARLPEHGVTAFLPTIITAPLEVYKTARQVLARGMPAGFQGAQPLGYHFEGPYLNPGKKGAHNPLHLRAPSQTETAAWSRKNGVWLVTLAPELSGAHELVRALRKKGIVVSAGHSLATYQQAVEAIQTGVNCATHLFNAMPPLDHRAPGLVAACLLDKQLTVGLIPDGIHADPAMLALAWKHTGPKRMTIVTDAMAALAMPAGSYQLGDYEVIVNENSARLQNGTLAGSILQMDQAVRNLVKFTGCSLPQAVETATGNVARLIRARTRGRLAPGLTADLVLLDAQGNLAATYIRGELAFSAT